MLEMSVTIEDLQPDVEGLRCASPGARGAYQIKTVQ
jgi:hypothetical protein